MTTFPRHLLAALATISLLPAVGQAATLTVHCGMAHYVRNGGTELASTTIAVRNSDPTYAATITSLAIRDGQGRVLLEFGPATAPLPLNTDLPLTYPGGRDITQVPPGGSVYLRSNHIWGHNGLPSGDAGNEVGQLMTATLVISKEGPRSHITVSTTPRIRERVFNPVSGTYREGETHSSGNTVCDVFPG